MSFALIAAVAATGTTATFRDADFRFAWHPTASTKEAPAFAYIDLKCRKIDDGFETTMKWSDNDENPANPTTLHEARVVRDAQGRITELATASYEFGDEKPFARLNAALTDNGLEGMLRTRAGNRGWRLAVPGDAPVFLDALEAVAFSAPTPEVFYTPAYSNTAELKNSFVAYVRQSTRWIDAIFDGRPGPYQVTYTTAMSDRIWTRTRGVVASGIGAGIVRDERGNLVAMEMPANLRVTLSGGDSAPSSATAAIPSLGRNGFLIRVDSR